MSNRAGIAFLVLAVAASGAFGAARKKPKKPVVKPRFDNPTIPFRMAPMPATSRSIAVSLLTNLHLAFDTENCRTHTVWSGQGLHLLGPQYSLSKRPFISTNDIPVLWRTPPWPPWTDEKPAAEPKPVSPVYRAVETRDGGTTFVYDLLVTGGEQVTVRETPRGAWVDGKSCVVRRIEVGPSKTDLWFAANSAFAPGKKTDNGFTICNIQTAAQLPFGSSVQLTSFDLEYQEEVFSEQGAEKGNAHIKRKGKLTTGWIHIPARKRTVTFDLATADCKTTSGTLTKALASDSGKPHYHPLRRAAASKAFSMSLASTPSYRVEPFRIRKELEMLVTGMAFMPNGDLAVATWVGDIYLVHNPTGDVGRMTFTRFATGLCEPMGIAVKNGIIHTGLKNELARVLDTDEDGVADRIERVRSDWSYSGHYNAFSYGPVIDRNGDFVLANAGHSGRWDLRYVGWAFSVGANGKKFTPISSGFREPNGIGIYGPDRDIFVSDNQGNWIGACRLSHVAEGKFYGHPSGWPAKKAVYGKPRPTSPATVWFPYKLARSTTDITEITSDQFGPFKGQLLVGDFQNAIVTRVMLEKIDGEYQGAVWPFLKRFQSGVNRLAFGPDGNLYVGGCQRTWASVATKDAAIERVRFTGKTPFEVQEVHAKPDGFALTFTKPVDPDSVGPDSWDVLQYRLKYHQAYGSPEYDHDGKKDSATAIDVTGASLSKDATKLRLKVKGWKTGYVTMVRSLDARDQSGTKLVNNTFWYTLNRLPKK